ncbi:MAG: ATP-binding protein [Clostridium sp.]|nr:MAG: ATP-binding protein [Clostridium sp.]
MQSKKLVSSIINLLDNSIEYIVYNNSDNILFKRFNEPEVNMRSSELIAILSAGTFRGVELYIRAINALKRGKVFIVDEIEDCFQKNLVYNLLFLFNDEKINKYGAQIIFSTHYVEILDYLKRRDGIFITHKENGKNQCEKNLYSDYDVRTELLKKVNSLIIMYLILHLNIINC